MANSVKITLVYLTTLLLYDHCFVKKNKKNKGCKNMDFNKDSRILNCSDKLMVEGMITYFYFWIDFGLVDNLFLSSVKECLNAFSCFHCALYIF